MLSIVASGSRASARGLKRKGRWVGDIYSFCWEARIYECEVEQNWLFRDMRHPFNGIIIYRNGYEKAIAMEHLGAAIINPWKEIQETLDTASEGNHRQT